MKTKAVLARMIPTLSAVRGSGAFNVVIAGLATPLAEELRVAANDDRITITDLLAAVERLSTASEFEPQQQAMTEILQLADRLLDAIAAGNVEYAATIANASRDLVGRISRDVASIRDIFAPDRAVLGRIRNDASELTTLVDAEIKEGLRPAEHATIAAWVFDAADRLQTNNYGLREQAGKAIEQAMMRLAA